MPPELVVALRFLQEGRAQTALILAGASMGVAVVLFLTGLLAGLEVSLIDQTLSAQAHIVVEGRRDRPEGVRPRAAGELVVIREVPGATRPVLLRGGGEMVGRLERVSGVRAVSPVAATSAFALRGALREPVVVQGVEPARHEAIVGLEERLVGGRLDTSGDGAVIGRGLARALALEVGDTFRLTGPEGVDSVMRVMGIARFGVSAADDGWVFTSVRRAQVLGGLGDEITRIDIQVEDPGDAREVAGRIRGGLEAEVASWQERNPDLLAGIRAQGTSGTVINLFVALAVALGIASVLAVSVVQRRGEIGVLRATGTPARTVLTIFLWQGALVGIIGSLVGSAVGVGLLELFVRFVRDETGEALFPIVVTWRMVAAACILALGTGLVAAIAPARSAARLDPVTAIRDR
ncbi:MAG: ABC transporter permease [Deltaproteobacteria bacterium]|nr:MAG: ABC transporter permease [Deltaproteobacteria bacterium]